MAEPGSADRRAASDITDAIALTLDVDWAPDFMIDDTAAILREQGVRATWMITHRSPAIDRLMASSEFEIGLHPNFLPGSTQGADPRATLSYLTAIAPEARCIRTHSLVQSTPLLKIAAEEYGISIDSSLLLSGAAGVRPHELRFSHGGPALVRLPYVWEDDIAMFDPGASWSDASDILPTHGIRILDFHPVHVYLNSRAMGPYERLRDDLGFARVTESSARPYVNTRSRGTRDLLIDVVEELAATPDRGALVSEIADGWNGV